jgi:hypothetical protein
MQRWFGIVMLACLAVMPLGCRPRQEQSEGSAPASRVAHFKQRQAATQLTHGRIKLDTVAESDGNRIRYQTSDGKSWLVEMTPDANGGYRYGTPEAAE